MDYSDFSTVDPANNAWFGTGLSGVIDQYADSSYRVNNRHLDPQQAGNANGAGYFDFSPYGVNFNTNTGSPGSDNDNPGFDVEGMQQWMADNNYTLKHMFEGGTGGDYRGLFSNKTNAPVNQLDGTPGNIQYASSDDPVFKMAMKAALAFANPGTLGAQFGLLGLGGQALGGAMIGSAGAGLDGASSIGDFAKGALTGAAGTGLASFNPASYLGVSNPILSGAINGGVRGGVGSALQGGDAGSAALSGALIGGLNGVGLGGDSMDDLPGTLGGNIDMAEGIGIGEPSAAQMTANDQAFALDPTVFNGTPVGRAYKASASNNQETAPFDIQSTLGDIFSNGIPNFSGGRVPLGDLAGGLMGLYQAYDQRKRAKNLAGQLSNNYGPNSAYAQQLRQSLMRKDAASGRRSQYGPREVEFQAKMADLNARMAPTLSQLNGQVGGSNMTMANSILNLGKLFGGKGFSGIGGGGQPQAPMNLPSLSNPMPAPNYSLGNPNGTLSGIRPEWLNTIGNGGG